MILIQRILERRRRKAHERYLAERDRQKALSKQDVEKAMWDVARRSGASQQRMYGQQ